LKRYLIILVLLGTMFAQGHNKPQEVHANCCLCMCKSRDETKCSAMCIRLQHSKKIVELPQINACTKSCERIHVKQVDYGK
jgi:hypothetical protein